MQGRSRRRGYVLAGGRSSRMGTDKAEVIFAGRTLLERAVAVMHAVCEDVLIVGVRERVPEGTAVLPDLFPGCGPMGGMEAALRDCQQHGAEFAVFVPVDVPLLPGGLLRALVEIWTESPGVRVAVAEADGRVQPLISMVHVDVLPAMTAALERGDYKLQPLLRMAAGAEAVRLQVRVESVFLATSLVFGDGERDGVVRTGEGVTLAWRPDAREWTRRRSWFANLNTPAELEAALAGGEKD